MSKALNNSKDNLNKCVFSFDLKASSVGNDQISDGNSFHSDDDAITNERSPAVTSFERTSSGQGMAFYSNEDQKLRWV